MDGSLASIFMNPATTHSWPCRDDQEECSILDPQSPEELQYKLMCTSMELQRAKAAALAEEKVHKARLRHLQEVLSILKKERDEAREECRKLQDCLSQQTTSSAESPCSFMHSSSMVSSPSSSPWSLQELEEHLNNDNYCDYAKTRTPMELHQALQSFSQSGNEEQGLQALFSIEPTCESILEDSQQHFSLEMLEQDLSFDADPCLNLAVLEKNEEGLQGGCELTQSTRSLSRQSSNSSSGSVQVFRQVQSSRDPTEDSAPINSSAIVAGADVAADAPMSALVNGTSLHVATSINNSIPVMGNLPINSPSPPLLKPILSAPVCAEGSPTMKSASSNKQAFAVQPVVSPPAKQGSSTPLRQVHLPEPPEADPQVMLSSLPEKGKLLQAVMQAGPLLQTLLLAGPLPQWRHPPPALSTGDIPKVSMVPSNVILQYQHHMPAPLLQGHVKYHTPISNGCASPVTRVRIANADPCSRTKKLRKLSPASPHQSQYMRMLSGEAVGVSYPSTIF